MGDFVRAVLQFVSWLWNFMVKRTDHIRNLKENLDSLENAMDRLKPVYEDVKERVQREEEQQGMKLTNEAAGWLRRVERMEADVIVILQEGKDEERKTCLGGCCPKNCQSSYKVGKRVCKLLDEVRELITEGRFDVVAEDVRATVNERPTEKTVGLDSMLEQVWRYIVETDLRIIGLYGLGGVGKTTLLKKINNEFLKRSCGFELVIWVLVSKQPDLEKIQEEILRQLQIPDTRWQHLTKERKAETIYGILKEKKFVLLLDDIWKRLDLVELGVLSHDPAMQKGVLIR